MSFSERLAWAVKKSGKTQLQVGIDAGVSAGAMYNYAVGKRSPDLDVAVRLAAAAGTTLAFLVGESSDAEGLVPQAEGSSEKALVGQALAVLGNPNLEHLAKDLGVSAREVRDWISGKNQPSHAQLVRLFNKVAIASEAVYNFMHGAERQNIPMQATSTRA